jgi:molybdopterin-guanine dinucleotide biosynthesis protein A
MGRPKHSLRLPGGTTMLEAVAAALGAVCAQVVVVGDVETGLRRIADLRPGQGPLGGLEALLASGLDTQYLVCPCDVPLVTPVLLARLTAPSDKPATVYRVEGEPDFWPLPARIAAGALDVARSRLDRGERAVHDFMRALRLEVVAVSKEDAGLLANVNTPEDFARLRPG